MPEMEHRFLLTGVREGALHYQYEIIDTENNLLYRSDRFARLEDAQEEALLMMRELQELAP